MRPFLKSRMAVIVPMFWSPQTSSTRLFRDWASEWGQKDISTDDERSSHSVDHQREEPQRRDRRFSRARRQLAFNQSKITRTKASALQMAPELPESTPLFMAARHNWSQGIENLILNGGEEIDQVADASGYTPLHVATMCGHTESVRVLLRLGANVTSTDRYGHNTLHFAAVGRNLEVLQSVLDMVSTLKEEEQMKVVYSSCSDSCVPLQNMLLHNTDIEMIHLLMSETNRMMERMAKRVEVQHEQSLGGWGETDRFSTTAAGSAPKRPAIFALKNSGDWSLLHLALKSGNLAVVKYIVGTWLLHENDPEKNTLTEALEEKNSDLWTALHHAVNAGQSEVVEYLLQLGAKPNTRNLGGWTPLHIAARNCDFRTARLLLEAGADPRALSDPQWSPLHIVSQKENTTRLVELLLQYGADPNESTRDDWTPAKLMIHGAQADNFEVLVKFGLNLRGGEAKRGSSGWTPLHNVAAAVELTRKSRGNGHNRRGKGQKRGEPFIRGDERPTQAGSFQMTDGQKDLNLAYENPQALEPLLRVGKILVAASLAGPEKSDLYLPIDCKTKAQWTPLHTAAKSGFLEFVKILIEEGKADINVQTEEGRTPLHCALAGSSYRCVEVVKYLIELGKDKIDLSLEAKQGGCAIHYLRCLKPELRKSFYPLIRNHHGQEAFDQYTLRFQQRYQHRDVAYVPPHYSGTSTERMQEINKGSRYLPSRVVTDLRQRPDPASRRDVTLPFKKVMQASGISPHLLSVSTPEPKNIQQALWSLPFESFVADFSEMRFHVDVIPLESGSEDNSSSEIYDQDGGGKQIQKEDINSGTTELESPGSYDSNWVTVFLGRPLDPRKAFLHHLIDQTYLLARSCSPVLFSKTKSAGESNQASTTDFHRCIHHLNARLANDLLGFRQAFSALDLELWIQMEACPYPEVWQVKNGNFSPEFSEARERDFWAHKSKPWRRLGPRIPSRLTLNVFDRLFNYTDEDYMHRLPENFYFSTRVGVRDKWTGTVERIIMFGPRKGSALNTLADNSYVGVNEANTATLDEKIKVREDIGGGISSLLNTSAQDQIGEAFGQWQFNTHSSLICYMKTLPHALKYTRGVVRKVIHLKQLAEKERIAKAVAAEKELYRKAASMRTWDPEL